MKSLLDYVIENQKEYKFTVKVACSDITDDMLDCLEDCLSKYDLVSAEQFKKSPILQHPIDFPRVKNSEIHTTEIITNYPATRDLLEITISEALGLDRCCVVVYSENDPRRISSYIREEDPKAHIGTDFEDDGYDDDPNARTDSQVDLAMDDFEERRKERRVDIHINDMSVKKATPDAKFDRQKPDTEVKKGIFFGRTKR